MSDITSARHHSGSKYIRCVNCIDGPDCKCPPGRAFIDVYDVVEAFGVSDMPVNHAVKKLLCAGLRSKGDRLQDLKEARDAISRAIQQEERRRGPESPLPLPGPVFKEGDGHEWTIQAMRPTIQRCHRCGMETPEYEARGYPKCNPTPIEIPGEVKDLEDVPVKNAEGKKITPREVYHTAAGHQFIWGPISSGTGPMNLRFCEKCKITTARYIQDGYPQCHEVCSHCGNAGCPVCQVHPADL